MTARPLLQWLISQSNIQVIITSTTQTGYDLAEKLFPSIQHYFLPYDLFFSIRQFIKIIRPTHILVMETELWPNLSWVCQQKNIPLILLNGRLSERSFKRYRLATVLFKTVLPCFTACLMQTEADAKRIEHLGAMQNKISVLGNLKFMQDVPEVSNDVAELISQIQLAWKKYPVLLIASTHTGEDELLSSIYQQLSTKHANLKLIIAPRHPERFDDVYTTLQNKTGPHNVIKRSEIKQLQKSTNIIVLDSIGELGQLYSIASIVVVAGSFLWQGGHNILEPMACGVPVVTGPYMKNFEAITQLAHQYQALSQPKTVDQDIIFNCLDDLLFSLGKREMLVENAKKLLADQEAILPKYKQALKKYLETTS